MKKLTILFAVTLLFSTITISAGLPVSSTTSINSLADISGTWNLEADTGNENVELSMTIKQKDADFSGTVSTPFGDGDVNKGKVDGSKITAVIDIEIQGQPMELEMKGEVEGDKMTGTIEGPGVPQVAFTGSKAK